jgi:hypothetical protein
MVNKILQRAACEFAMGKHNIDIDIEIGGKICSRKPTWKTQVMVV